MSARVTTLADRQAALWALRERARQAELRVVQGEGAPEKSVPPPGAQRPLTEPPISGVRHRRPATSE